MPKVSAPRTYTLRRASSVVFALVSVLPLLLFSYTLHALNVLNEYLAQIALGSALALAAVGFYIYSVMISRLSDILRNLEIDEAQPSAPAAPPGPVVTMAVEPTAGSPMSAAHGAVSRFAAAQSPEGPASRLPKPRPPPPAARGGGARSAGRARGGTHHGAQARVQRGVSLGPRSHVASRGGAARRQARAGGGAEHRGADQGRAEPGDGRRRHPRPERVDLRHQLHARVRHRGRYRARARLDARLALLRALERLEGVAITEIARRQPQRLA